MKKLIVMALMLPLVLGAAGAWADQVTGKVQKVDAAERMVTLEDGTNLWIAEGVSIDEVKEGTSVKASYEERDGKKVVTTLEVSN